MSINGSRAALQHENVMWVFDACCQRSFPNQWSGIGFFFFKTLSGGCCRRVYAIKVDTDEAWLVKENGVLLFPA